MIAFLMAAALLRQAPDVSVVLTRGGMVRGIPIWDVEDATLDAAKPGENSEGDEDLAGGPFKTILIRFGDIDRVVPANRRVTRATLVLTVSGGDAPKIREISRVRLPWGAGPFRTLGGFIRPHAVAVGEGAAAAVTPPAPTGSATWRERRSEIHGGSWEQPGARGSRDTEPITTAKFTADASQARIEGLGPAVQDMANHPGSNCGFAIVLDNKASFASSEADSGRPRLELETEDAPPAKGADLSVVLIDRKGPDGKLPTDGQTATYTAHVKNVGDAPSTGFDATWIIDDRTGATATTAKALAPGEETTVSYGLPYRPDRTDHRFQTIGLRIVPKGDDASPRNDELTVPATGTPVTVVVSFPQEKKIKAGLNGLGSASVEDWVQQQVRTLNDVYLAHSRFSFAPEGAKERVVVQQVLVGDQSMPFAKGADGSARVDVVGVPDGLTGPYLPFLRGLAGAIGLVDGSASNVPESANELLPCGAADRFPGLMGYGDTRFDGLAPGQLELPYEAFPAPVFDNPPMEATGLLASTDVLRINATLGGPAVAMPKAVLIRARNQADLPLANLVLQFFRPVGGRIPKDAKSAFSLTTDAAGEALLSNPGAAFKAADETNGAEVLFVRATSNGVAAGSWLKAWQVIDTVARGGAASRAIAIMALHFDLPSAELDPATNLAADRIVTDSAGSLPAKLATLIDGSVESETSLGGKAGDWVEIDLGRDRTIGEVDLIGQPGAFWSKFDIVAYGTGQRPEEAALWAKEVDWPWTSTNRSETVGAGRVSVPYRGAVARVRYLRIISRSAAPGRLAEIRVVPVKNP